MVYLCSCKTWALSQEAVGGLHDWHPLESSSHTGLTPAMTGRLGLELLAGTPAHGLQVAASSKGETLECISRDKGESYNSASKLASGTILASFPSHFVGYK